MRGSNFFQRYILHNLGLKIVSLAIAVLLWVAIASAPQAEAGFIVPIEFLNVPKGMEINMDAPPQAEVRLRGSDRMVHRISNSDLHMAVDVGTIASAQPGEKTFELTGGMINVPAGVEVVQIIPSSVRVSFDKRVYRNLEVRPRVLGSFSPGYRIASVSADPAEVAVVGPEKRVSAVEAATTDPIDASGVLGKHVFVANPYVQDPMVRLSRPVAVHVTVVTEKTK